MTAWVYILYTSVHQQHKVNPMNPFLFEELYERLGRPRWFWPVVAVVLIVLFGLAGAVTA